MLINIRPCVSLIARLALFASVSQFSSDPTWWISKTENWVLAEYASGLICASLIHLKPLVKALVPCLLGPACEQTKEKMHILPLFCPRKYSVLSHPSDRRYGNSTRVWRSVSPRSADSEELSAEMRPMVRVTTRVEIEELPVRQVRSPDRVLTWAPKAADRPDTFVLRHTFPV